MKFLGGQDFFIIFYLKQIFLDTIKFGGAQTKIGGTALKCLPVATGLDSLSSLGSNPQPFNWEADSLPLRCRSRSPLKQSDVGTASDDGRKNTLSSNHCCLPRWKASPCDNTTDPSRSRWDHCFALRRFTACFCSLSSCANARALFLKLQ